jgi:hypothetical protein
MRSAKSYPITTTPWPQRFSAAALAGVRWSFFVLATLWAAGAIYVDGPLGMKTGNAWLAVGWLAVTIGCLALIRAPWKRFLVWLVLFLAVLVPWLGKHPSNDRAWKPEWAQTGWVDLKGGELSFHNFRNFDYGTDGSVTEHWETRKVHLRNLKGMDYFHVPFGGDLIAHPILSFDFGSDGHVALSVETRREAVEDYSEIGGLYKMFELQYLWGDERDFIRVRTNVRNEPVYLYRTALTPEETLFVLLDSIRATNWLKEQPRFYDVISANCTTSLLAQTLEFRNAPFDVRMIANGRLDELIYEKGGFLGEALPFAEMRQRAFINPTAQAAREDPDFSTRIREGRPGFD